MTSNSSPVSQDAAAAPCLRYNNDGLGRRIAKVIGDPTSTSPDIDLCGDWEATYHYYYSGQSMIETRNNASPTNDVIKQHVGGVMYVDELLQIGINDDPADAGEDDCETFYWTCQDANYNVTELFESDGDLAERYIYTCYGRRYVFKPASGESPVFGTKLIAYSQPVQIGGEDESYGLCEIGHQGLMHDKEIALIYNRARYLEPVMGRSLQRDPLGYADGMSLYEDRWSSPTNVLDPSGLYRQDVHEDLTYLLALAAGFCREADARLVARANQAQDDPGRAAPGLRIWSGWKGQILADLWHLPGAYANGGSGRVDIDRNPTTRRMLLLLERAALYGGTREESFAGYRVGHGSRTSGADMDSHVEGKISVVSPKKFTTSEAVYIMNKSVDDENNLTTQIIIGVGPLPAHRLRMVGVWLHALQDTYAHHRGRLGHPNMGPGSLMSTHADVQRIVEFRARAVRMAQETSRALRRFLLRNPKYAIASGRPHIAYNTRIGANVRRFLFAGTEEAQKAAYDAILKRLRRFYPDAKLKDYSKGMQEVKYPLFGEILDPFEILGRAAHEVARLVQPRQQ